MKKKIFCFDIDNTICTTKKNNYKTAKPKKKIIELINKLYKKGHIIKIFTSRFMGRNNENISRARRDGLSLTYKQLSKWKLSYHKLIMGKPSYDLIIDDKSFDYDKKWPSKIKKKYL